MKCYKCKYHKEGVGDYGSWNECTLFGFEYYFEFYEKDCPYIDEDYNKTNEGQDVDKYSDILI